MERKEDDDTQMDRPTRVFLQAARRPNAANDGVHEDPVNLYRLENVTLLKPSRSSWVNDIP
jgi:hypothetical protein